MTQGFPLIVITGIFWAGLAAVTAAATASGSGMDTIQPLSALLILIVTGGYAFFQPGIPEYDAAMLFQMFCLIAAGALTYRMLKLVQRGMALGNEGIVWAFTQSAMLIPFSVGILFFGEQATCRRMAGLTLLLVALALFAVSRGAKKGRGASWLVPVFAAFLLAGTAQSISSLPSYLRLEGMTAFRRMLLTQTGIVLAAAADFGIRRKLPSAGRREWVLAALFGSFNLIALVVFYNALNILAEEGGASMGYPAAQGTGIAVFFLGNRFAGKAKVPLSGWIAFFLLLTGIALFAAR